MNLSPRLVLSLFMVTICKTEANLNTTLGIKFLKTLCLNIIAIFNINGFDVNGSVSNGRFDYNLFSTSHLKMRLADIGASITSYIFCIVGCIYAIPCIWISRSKQDEDNFLHKNFWRDKNFLSPSPFFTNHLHRRHM